MGDDKLRSLGRTPLFEGVDMQGREFKVYIHPQMDALDQEIALLVTAKDDENGELYVADLRVDREQALAGWHALNFFLGEYLDVKIPKLVNGDKS